MAVLIEQKGGYVFVQDRGGPEESFDSVAIHGCDTSIPGRGRISVYGEQAMWEEDGTLHISEDRRDAPSDSGSLGSLGGML